MKHKGAALADDDLLGQGFRYDELAPKTSSGDGSQPSNGGMHLRGPVGWLDTRKKIKANNDWQFLIQYRESTQWRLRQDGESPAKQAHGTFDKQTAKTLALSVKTEVSLSTL